MTHMLDQTQTPSPQAGSAPRQQPQPRVAAVGEAGQQAHAPQASSQEQSLTHSAGQAVQSVAEMLAELEQIWRGRIARIDALIAADPEPEQEH
jgi:hypothetical protein